MYDNFSPKNSTLDNLLAEKQQSPRQEKRKHRFHLGNGAALILVALMIISLLCFAALSIVSAKADSRLTDRYAAQITAYHTARNLGVEFLAETDAQLKQYLEDSGKGTLAPVLHGFFRRKSGSAILRSHDGASDVLPGCPGAVSLFRGCSPL